MASDDESRLNVEENFEWNVENEIRLFEAMIGHKPVGINKHFHMACISEKFESLLGKPVSSDVIWKHLETMYDLAALDKKESLPFPNDPEEFCLPEAEYLDLINEKISTKAEGNSETKETLFKEGRTTPKVVKDTAPVKETKKEKKSDSEDTSTSTDLEKKEVTDSENEGKKGKLNKDEKVVKTRGKRSTKDKKSEEELSQTNVSGSKKEEENNLVQSSTKKEKNSVGKRTLRSRIDDVSNKSLTPPPAKRARRI